MCRFGTLKVPKWYFRYDLEYQNGTFSYPFMQIPIILMYAESTKTVLSALHPAVDGRSAHCVLFHQILHRSPFPVRLYNAIPDTVRM